MENSKQLFRLVGELLETSVYLLQADTQQLDEIIDNALYNPLHLLKKAGNEQLSTTINHYVPHPRLRKSQLFERFILLSCGNEQTFTGTLIIGPFAPSPLSDSQLYTLIKDHHAFAIQTQVSQYYRTLPISSTDKLIKLSQSLHRFLTQDDIGADVIKKDYQKSLSHSYDEPLEKAEQENFQYAQVNYERLFESEILKVVKNGEINSLKKGFFVIDEEQSALYSRASYLRSLKNHLITLVALVSRTALDAGVPSPVALVASDQYILQIEEALSLDFLYATATDMLTFFTTQVHENQTRMYSSLVLAAFDFILKNIYLDFQLPDIAAYTAVSPNYLSTVFHQETGHTITYAIQQQRIKEAKHILKTSRLSIAEISDLLLFSDQSYFTKVFKKHTGFTPHHYRKARD